MPFVLLGVAAAAGLAGVANLVRGATKFSHAQTKAKKAEARHKAVSTTTQAKIDALNVQAAAYGQQQVDVATTTVARFVKLIRNRGQRVAAGEMEALEGFDLIELQLDGYEGLVTHLGGLVSGGAKAVGVAVGVQQGVLAMVGLLGTASTGTAISGLSGAALTNATLAWLGGGSLAAGGGGMALGTMVLTGLAAGPAVLVGGLVVNGQGERASTKAAEFEAKVSVDIAKQRQRVALLNRVGRRLDELADLLSKLDERASASIDRLDSADPDDGFALKFQDTAMLVAALAEILRTPILFEGGDGEIELNEATSGLLVRYPLCEESNA